MDRSELIHRALATDVVGKLTGDEQGLFFLLASGRGPAEAAAELGVSPDAVLGRSDRLWSRLAELLSEPPEGSVAPMDGPTPRVPPAVLEQVLRNFDEARTEAEVRRAREGGGLALADFIGELEQLARPPG